MSPSSLQSQNAFRTCPQVKLVLVQVFFREIAGNIQAAIAAGMQSVLVASQPA